MKRVGKQPRRYKFFFLNPYQDVRFSYCPKCNAKTKLRKVFLVVQLQPSPPTALNKSCRYCPSCDLLIAHQNELEQQLGLIGKDLPSPVSDNLYQIMGTMDRADWQQNSSEPMTDAQMLECLCAFKQILKFEPSSWIKLNVQWKGLEESS